MIWRKFRYGIIQKWFRVKAPCRSWKATQPGWIYRDAREAVPPGVVGLLLALEVTPAELQLN